MLMSSCVGYFQPYHLINVLCTFHNCTSFERGILGVCPRMVTDKLVLSGTTLFIYNIFYFIMSIKGISFQDDPEWFDWFNAFRKETCDKTVDDELVPLWKRQAVTDQLGMYNMALYTKQQSQVRLNLIS